MNNVIIIGAGQSGLVTGYYLRQQSIKNFLILDANEQIGGSWQHYWDSLTLFSSAKYSSLDGLPFPENDHYYPTRDDVIEYLQQYAENFNLPVICNARVETVQRQGDWFEVYTADGQCFPTKAVVTATGEFNKPYIPDLMGQDDFRGKQLHSYAYCNPEPFVGERIVVVGSHNSAVQIGVELASVANVSLAVIKDINFAPTHKWGKDIFFFIHDTGFDMLPIGCNFNLCASDAVYDDGTYQAAVEAGNPDVRPMFERITANGVVWSDGVEEAIDTILYATGFDSSNKSYLSNLNALQDGIPQHKQGISTTEAGLFYIGLEGQIAPASATLRGVSRDACVIAEAVTQYLAEH